MMRSLRAASLTGQMLALSLAIGTTHAEITLTVFALNHQIPPHSVSP
jgi:hypothetical protein